MRVATRATVVVRGTPPVASAAVRMATETEVAGAGLDGVVEASTAAMAAMEGLVEEAVGTPECRQGCLEAATVSGATRRWRVSDSTCNPCREDRPILSSVVNALHTPSNETYSLVMSR